MEVAVKEGGVGAVSAAAPAGKMGEAGGAGAAAIPANFRHGLAPLLPCLFAPSPPLPSALLSCPAFLAVSFFGAQGQSRSSALATVRWQCSSKQVPHAGLAPYQGVAHFWRPACRSRPPSRVPAHPLTLCLLRHATLGLLCRALVEQHPGVLSEDIAQRFILGYPSSRHKAFEALQEATVRSCFCPRHARPSPAAAAVLASCLFCTGCPPLLPCRLACNLHQC